ncbi:MAG: permease [Planctomycetaceae bacterium]|nr:permease [Planctomycetaceae bacterium]
MFEAIFWGVLLRISQSALQGAPFIFTGLCVAGLLHRLMGHAATKRLFGSNSVSSQLQSWLIGMVLPGCSLGVIPIVKQLRRSSISVGTIFAFALASPLFDPLSLLYGLTLSKPMTIVAFAFCSLAVLTISGSLFDWWFPATEVEMPEPTPTPPGVKRLLAILVVMARESVSGTAGLIGVGLLGAGLLSVLLPPGSLQSSMNHQNALAPLTMTAVAIPAYATPMTAMSQLGSMFQHGNSVGAAFILLTFGAGMNLGLLVWMVRNYGWKKATVWFGLMVSIVLILSYGIEQPLYPKDIEPADHSHAFDAYCGPFRSDYRPTIGYPAEIIRRLRQETQRHEFAGALFLAVTISLGGFLKCLDRRWVIETWLNRPRAVVAGQPVGRWDMNVPGPVLALCGLGVIIAISIVGCFAYYPAPEEALEELKVAKTEALGGLLSRHFEHMGHWIPVCEAWNRRLQVGVYLRHGRLSDYHRMKSRILQNHLELLEHMAEDQAPREDLAREIAATSRAFSRLVVAYREELQ